MRKNEIFYFIFLFFITFIKNEEMFLPLFDTTSEYETPSIVK